MDTDCAMICNSRPRRFGKSITANMLTAYYSRGCDSTDMFADLAISKADSYAKHLNKYDVIHLVGINYDKKSKSHDCLIEQLAN